MSLPQRRGGESNSLTSSIPNLMLRFDGSRLSSRDVLTVCLAASAPSSVSVRQPLAVLVGLPSSRCRPRAASDQGRAREWPTFKTNRILLACTGHEQLLWAACPPPLAQKSKIDDRKSWGPATGQWLEEGADSPRRLARAFRSRDQLTTGLMVSSTYTCRARGYFSLFSARFSETFERRRAKTSEILEREKPQKTRQPKSCVNHSSVRRARRPFCWPQRQPELGVTSFSEPVRC